MVQIPKLIVRRWGTCTGNRCAGGWSRGMRRAGGGMACGNGRRSVRSVLAEQVLAVVNPDTRHIRLKSVEEPYCERLDHTPGHLSTVQPGNFGRLCGWLRGTRNGAATEDQGHDAKAHVLVDARQSAGLDGDAS